MPATIRPVKVTANRLISFCFLWICALLILSAALPLIVSAPADAQITKTSRIELKDRKSKVYIAPEAYITLDPEKKLTPQIIATRYQNNLRGTKLTDQVLNLGLKPEPAWLVFSVTNSSDLENWFLNFGSLLEGRTGTVREIALYNYSTGETIMHISRDKDTPEALSSKLYGASIPVFIEKDKTDLFVLFIDADSKLANTFTPAFFSPGQHYKSLGLRNIGFTGMRFLLIGALAFFLTVSYIEKNYEYLVFAGYYLLNLILFILMNSAFFLSYSFLTQLSPFLFAAIILCSLAACRTFLRITAEDHTENTMIFSLASFVVACALFSLIMFEDSLLKNLLIFIPAIFSLAALSVFSFLQGQNSKHAGHYMAAAWLIGFFGCVLSGLACAGVFSANGFTINAYWYFLLPQGAFFMIGTHKKVLAQQDEQRTLQARENRAAQSLARLKQSKESADQARLLRVIERERELMAELREREMLRTEEMRRAKEAADIANRAKSAFLAAVSHEIRTPMTGIMGIMRLLKDTKLSKEQGDYIMTIQKSGDTMMALLNDILDFEKIETGKMDLEIIDFDLPKLAQGVVTLMSGHAADKGLSLRCDIPPDFPSFLRCDPTRLRQVLLNLVNNALKFTEKGSVILRLRASKLAERPQGVKGDYEVYLAVEDTGIGISEEAQANLFVPFQQADTSVSRKYGGTGLGLAISQRLVEAMGGAISLKSELGKGSTFFFTLLMETGKASAAEEADSHMVMDQARAKITPQKILVIEDNEINRKVLQNFLEKDGHMVSMAETGEDAVDLCRQKSFDVIFTDIRLPGMSGIETAKTIRTMPDRKIADTPIIAITGNVGQEDVEACYAAGINDFIGKPIDYNKLVKTLMDVQAGRFRPPEKPAVFTAKPAPSAKPEPVRPEKKEPEEKPKKPEKPLQFEETEKPTKEEKGSIGAPIHEFLKSKDGGAKPAAPVNPADIFDQKMLENLLRTLGKPQFMELMGGYSEKAAEIVQTLETLRQAPNMEEIHEHAHEMKGMAANFGMKELAKISGAIEKSTKNNNEKETMEHLAKMADAHARSETALKDWLKNI